MNTVPSDALPSTFGKYRILSRISVGGMAEIYKARSQGPGGFSRTFAIKRILPHLSTHQEFVDMLVDEAKIAGLLSHANIVQILEFDIAENTYYIAMEYVDGPDLGRLLQRCKERGHRIPVPHATYIMLEVLKGLEYAHNHTVSRDGQPLPLHIVHRDVTPGNVLVSVQGEVKLTDFGIAKASVKALETLSGVVKGRFDYLSPEQASAKPLDARSDLFSAGVLLYEMVTGKNPFARQREAESILAIREGRYDPPRKVQPDLPAGLDEIIRRALELDPGRRYQTATEMKEALSRFFHGAGFVFSRETLAAFVVNLFPRTPDEPVAPPPPARSAPPPPTVPGPPTAPTPSPAPPRAPPVPSLESLAPSSAVGLDAAGLGDVDTVIQPPIEPTRPDSGPPRRIDRLASLPLPGPSPVPAPAPAPPIIAPAAPGPAPESPAEAAPMSVRMWILAILIISTMVGLVAAATGFYLGVQRGRAERDPAPPASAPAAQHHAPPSPSAAPRGP